MVHGQIGYIVAAYTVAGVVIGGLVVAILLDYRSLRRQLARLEKRTGPDKDMP